MQRPEWFKTIRDEFFSSGGLYARRNVVEITNKTCCKKIEAIMMIWG